MKALMAIPLDQLKNGGPAWGTPKHPGSTSLAHSLPDVPLEIHEQRDQ
jgi:hypothetical protein